MIGYSESSKDNSFREALRHIINFVVFVIVTLLVINKLSWIYRSNDEEGREVISGFKNMDGKIDVVNIGSSNFLRYYMPLQAYSDYGFTSYNFATSSAEFDMIRYYIEEASKYKKSDLYVVNVGCILYMSPEVRESALKNWSDTLDIWDFIRLKSINSYLSARDSENIDVSSYYFDLAKYHNNNDILGNRNQYKIHKRSFNNLSRGFFPYTTVEPFEEPAVSDEVGKLTEQEHDAIMELLDYCDITPINVLFISTPYCIDEFGWQKLNAAGELIENRGYDFINFNRNYDDIGIDFAIDLGNAGHVNYYGAEKFTDYFARYLKKNYQLPDHRGDPSYRNWDADVISFAEHQIEWREQTEISRKMQ